MVIAYSDRMNFDSSIETHFDKNICRGDKTHSFRKKSKRTYKSGQTLHHSYHVRTPKQKCFSKTTCTGVQKAVFSKTESGRISLTIDSHSITGRLLHEVAYNDGFGNLHEFEQWFLQVLEKEKTDNLEMVLVHWTPIRYK